MKKKRKRISRPVQKQEVLMYTTDAGETIPIKIDGHEVVRGEPWLEVIIPRTAEEHIAILNAENTDDSVLWKTQKLSVEEIIERYPLTEEQIAKLKAAQGGQQS
jgi:hypothetical protein